MTSNDASYLAKKVLGWADSVAARMGMIEPPVDVISVARQARVKNLRIRPIITRGALVPIEGGFEMYVRDLKERNVDIGAPEFAGLFTTRQRFVVAHELAHTRFYDASEPLPLVKDAPTNQLIYEELCDRAASRILVPSVMLRRDIEQTIGGCEAIDVEYIRGACRRFSVSPHVFIKRLRAVEPSNIFERCIILATRRPGGAIIMASYFGMGLVSIVPKPESGKPIANWLKDIPPRIFGVNQSFEGEFSLKGRRFVYKKHDLNAYGDFLLQVGND